MQFRDIIGQKEIKDQLVHTVVENRVSHAQLFLGPEGSGTLALALAYAQFINCEDKLPTDSCGQCASCRKYAKLIHPDLHFSYPFFAKHKEETATDYMESWREVFLKQPYLSLEQWKEQLDADNKQANINIAEAHAILKKLSLKSFEAEYKVLIMWLPEYLEKEGNALLKLIEEPPEKTLFLLVAENQDRILNTIISRTQLVKIHKLKNTEVSQYLQQQLQVAPAEAEQIAFMADGNLALASTLLADSTNNYQQLLVDWLRLIVTDNGTALIKIVEEEFSKMGREALKSFLRYGINIFRQILLIQHGLPQLVLAPEKELNFVHKFAENYATEKIQETINCLEETHYSVTRNAHAKILILDLSLQLVLMYKYQTFPKGTQYI
ncbi:hypothetical protein J5U18_11570 [Sphingobacteriaceae bacterium WQ 2009]|uniref:DNA polymerase-3 subunit delta n=1 Tax=Rhinopithecimicrobium faecis TaxID=2820698 RepID=A0A8T4HCJ8_9SPHI|nr:hypothetical protein [Sphingobacteriaceae bacterium WQ 2009]